MVGKCKNFTLEGKTHLGYKTIKLTELVCSAMILIYNLTKIENIKVNCENHVECHL